MFFAGQPIPAKKIEMTKPGLSQQPLLEGLSEGEEEVSKQLEEVKTSTQASSDSTQPTTKP
jgi:hypothetical protein